MMCLSFIIDYCPGDVGYALGLPPDNKLTTSLIALKIFGLGRITPLITGARHYARPACETREVNFFVNLRHFFLIQLFQVNIAHTGVATNKTANSKYVPTSAPQ